jgi:hypothetical protein
MQEPIGSGMDTIIAYLLKFAAFTLPPPERVLIPIRVEKQQRLCAARSKHAHPAPQMAVIWPTPKPRSRIRQAPRPLTKRG